MLPEAFDRDAFALNCLNGVVDLRTATIRPHQREDYLTKLCPTAFKPDAPAPAFRRFLDAIFAGNRNVVGFERRFAGYSLTGDVREQIIAIYHGGGSNGKSTLLNAMGLDYAMNAPRGFLMAQRNDRHLTEQFDLRGKRFVSAAETGDGKRLDEELVKTLTGGESIRARKLYADHEEFPPTHKLCISTNHRPRIRGTDHAVWRRVVLVPFAVKFWNPSKGESGPAELMQDKTLKATLEEEAEGILSWMIHGAAEWFHSGLEIPAEVVAATESYRENEDVMGRFVADCCETAEGKTPFKEIYEALEGWSKDAGENAPSRKAAAEWLENHGFYREKSRYPSYRGIGIKA